jgi:hypothetical protein
MGALKNAFFEEICAREEDDREDQLAILWAEIEQDKQAEKLRLIETVDALIAGIDGIQIVSRSNPRIFSYCSIMRTRAQTARAMIEELVP